MQWGLTIRALIYFVVSIFYEIAFFPPFLNFFLCLFRNAIMNTHRDPGESLYHKGYHHYCEGKYWEAMSFFLQAGSTYNHSNAQQTLGYMYEVGKGIPVDEQQSLAWYTRAANNGIVEAQYKAGLLYIKAARKGANRGTYVEALRWLIKAGNSGHVDAEYSVGVMLRNGEEGVPKDDCQAYQWFTRAALKGHPDALCHVALSYHFGLGTEKSLKNAVFWYEKGAERGNPVAQCNLGLMYKDGHGVSKPDFQQAFRFLSMSANSNYEYAFFWMGYFLEKGVGTVKNEAEAKKWYDKGAQLGKLDCQYSLDILECPLRPGEGALEHKANVQSLQMLRDAASNGDAEASYKIGNLYYKGEYGFAQDLGKARRWYEKAASGGHADSTFDIANMYENGEGVSVDYKKAMELYLDAYKKGSHAAPFRIALMYCFNRGVEKNDKVIMHWVGEALKRNYSKGYLHLAYIYHFGKAIQVDFKEALKWYERAIQYDDSDNSSHGFRGMAMIYHQGGNNVQRDHKKAEEYYVAAVEAGNTEAMHGLGELYYYRVGEDKHFERARYWYELAAEEGYALALHSLGRMYCRGLGGLEKNYVTAMEYYVKALEGGNCEQAMCSIGELYEKGFGVRVNYQKAMEWYVKATENGDKNGFVQIGLLYQHGLGVSRNLKTAFEYFTKAGKYNDRADDALGMLVSTGVDGKRDYSIAFNCFTRAAYNFNESAFNNLGLCYKSGLGVERNFHIAIEYFLLGAEFNYGLSQYYMGIMYLYGLGVEADDDNALEWFLKAKENGSKDVHSLITSIVSKQKGPEEDEDDALWNKIDSIAAERAAEEAAEEAEKKVEELSVQCSSIYQPKAVAKTYQFFHVGPLEDSTASEAEPKLPTVVNNIENVAPVEQKKLLQFFQV